MKKFFQMVLPICLLMISFDVKASTYENKGRKYYEEAGQIVWEIKTDEKIIALTFDDGPHRKYTTQILDILEKYNAKATFFYSWSKCRKKILKLFQECIMKVMSLPIILSHIR